MTIRSCIYAESHLTATLEMVRDRPELQSIVPLLERALVEIGAVRQAQTLLFKVRAAAERNKLGSGS